MDEQERESLVHVSQPEEEDSMTAIAEPRVDEQATLSTLETHITKRQEVARLREVVSSGYRDLSVCEADAQKANQQVDQLENRLKAFHKQVLLGAAKAGELPALKDQLAAAKERTTKLLHALDEQREAFCLAQETLTQLRDELQEQQKQLRDNLSRLFDQRFVEDDVGLYGRRGHVSWMDPDPNSPERYAKQWRARVFNFLLFRGLSADLTESHFLHALVVFFRQEPFHVKVVSGFVPVTSKDKEGLGVGELITVPCRLSEQEAFEEIARRRVLFMTEA
jgi:hypothetical protein